MIHGMRKYDAQTAAILGGLMTFVLSAVMIGVLYGAFAIAGRF